MVVAGQISEGIRGARIEYRTARHAGQADPGRGSAGGPMRRGPRGDTQGISLPRLSLSPPAHPRTRAFFCPPWYLHLRILARFALRAHPCELVCRFAFCTPQSDPF